MGVPRASSRAIRVLAWTLGLCFLLATPTLAKPSTKLEIEPGPTSITPEERAMESDPAHGAEHAVILLEETSRSEDALRFSVTSFHLRAKILSNEGRPLANVEIPYVSRDGRLKRWWGRTIQPDGTVRELKEEELDHQSMIKTTWGEVRAMKGALPGVAPGCVIDYGYVLEDTSIQAFNSVDLQRAWMIREIRYRWQPANVFPAAYRLRRTEGKDVQVTKAPREILLVAHNLPPVVQEPLMPPDQEVRASAVFYYLPQDADNDYWNTESKRIERRLKSRIGNVDRFREALAVMKLPPEADLKARVTAAYDWIAANVKNGSLISLEEEEMGSLDEDDDEGVATWSARSVLDERKGEGRQIDVLFIAAARALGAEANLVLVTDRTRGFWDNELFSTEQFATSVVAVRGPDDAVEKTVFADPGSGLPYGEVPWWTAGAHGFMATKDGARRTVLNASKPDRNVADAEAHVAFSDDNGTMKMHWKLVKTGQQGLDERRYLRSLAAQEREKFLDNLCGGTGTTEVIHAAAPDLDNVTTPFRLECETENSGTSLDEDTTSYHLAVGGPWFEEIADLAAPTRVHPVVFPYLHTDFAKVDFVAPHGFEPIAPPPLIQTGVPYASYALSVAKTETGYHVTRSVTFRALMVPASEYESLRKFLTDVRKADRTMLEFRRIGERE